MKRADVNKGDVFGGRTVIEEIPAKRVKVGTKRMFKVQCQCGAVSVISYENLKRRPSRCRKCPSTIGGLQIGDRFGKRVVISKPYRRSNSRQLLVDTRCDCGNESTTDTSRLLSGKTTRCSHCRDWSKDEYKEFRPFKHHYLYGIWKGIKSRICYQVPGYEYYGGRGLTMEDEWKTNFGAFALWVQNNLGPRPGKGWSIDRIDANYGYHPTKPDGSYQLRWATSEMQNNNRRSFKRNWGTWKVGQHIGSLFYVCQKWGVFDTNVKQYTKATTKRPAMTLEDAISHVIKKKIGATPEIKCLQPAEL